MVFKGILSNTCSGGLAMEALARNNLSRKPVRLGMILRGGGKSVCFFAHFRYTDTAIMRLKYASTPKTTLDFPLAW
ncbi:MAG: hypothetical protein KDI01_10030 [Halioglobus sp.]|nr:hypothetical protein [Halioglobus sp.]